MNYTAETTAQTAEREIERLAQEMDRVIQREEPEKRQELRLLASALVNERLNPSGTELVADGRTMARRPVGIVAGSLVFLIVGVALFLLLPAIGLILISLGLAGTILGALLALLRTPSPTSR